MKAQTIVAVFFLVVGLLLMAGKIYFDSEPGLLPLLLVVVSGGWLLVARIRSRKPR